MPCLAAAGSRCHNKGNTLRQQQRQLADILVQIRPDNDVACCRVGSSRGADGRVVTVQRVYVLVLYFPASEASSSTSDKYLRFRGCPVVMDIELSVSARYLNTCVLLRAQRLLLLLVAATSGGVRHTILGQILNRGVWEKKKEEISTACEGIFDTDH